MSKDVLNSFVETAKQRGISNGELTELLVQEGWSRKDIAQAIYGDSLVIPSNDNPSTGVGKAQGQSSIQHSHQAEPIAVVQNLSTRGFEYYIMFVSLWVSAFSLGSIFHQFINNAFEKTSVYSRYDSYSSSDGGEYTLPLTVIIVTLPIFIVLFLRLKKAELLQPRIKKDPSRKKLTQATQFFSFLIGIGYLIWFIYSLMSGRVGADGANTFGELFLHLIVTLAIAGGIFAYYWIEEHRSDDKAS